MMSLLVRHSLRIRLVIAVALLASLYFVVDWHRFAAALVDVRPWYIALAMLLFVPQTLVSAVRWRLLVRPLGSMSTTEAVRQILVASAWNLIAPAKSGDFSKAAAHAPRSSYDLKFAAKRVFVEKLADVAALVALCVVARSVSVAPRVTVVAASAVVVVIAVIAVRPLIYAEPALPWRLRAAARCTLLTLALWSLHLVQIDWFLKAADVFVPWHVSVARVPLALFAGIVPITHWGLGTRDAALVWLFSDVAHTADVAVAGLLTASRYLVPGLAGVAVMLWPALASRRDATSSDKPHEQKHDDGGQRPTRPGKLGNVQSPSAIDARKGHHVSPKNMRIRQTFRPNIAVHRPGRERG